jgi:hypothetical protein
MTYKLYRTTLNELMVKIDHSNGSVTCIPFDPANTDYQAYLAWVDAGNTPEAAD